MCLCKSEGDWRSVDDYDECFMFLNILLGAPNNKLTEFSVWINSRFYFRKQFTVLRRDFVAQTQRSAGCVDNGEQWGLYQLTPLKCRSMKTQSVQLVTGANQPWQHKHTDHPWCFSISNSTYFRYTIWAVRFGYFVSIFCPTMFTGAYGSLSIDAEKIQ